MTKKSFVVILILSVVTMYGVSIIDAVVNNTLLGGKSGFPFKDSSATMFGEGTTDYLLMTLNIIFWFIVLFGIWKLIKRTQKK